MGARLVSAIVLISGLAAAAATERPRADVDTARILRADSEPGNWLTHGRTYGEQRFSPLKAINTETVGRLGLAWSYDLRMGRGAEATPIVVDGVMYVTSAWSFVHAIDARTGRGLWVYDPKVDRTVGAKACCDVVNRGVAVYAGKIFVGVIDGRLVAFDARTGSVAWETVTVDPSQPYTITGAPRAANGLVYIGNGGAEYGVRGYVSAYDVETGALRWRFYTVPGDPAKGPDGAASDGIMARVTATWTGQWWKGGGGGTVWDAIVSIPSSTSSSWAWETARPGISRFVHRGAATTCSWLRSWLSMRRPAPTSGTTRPPRVKPGTTRPPSPSCWRTCRLAGWRARSRCRPPRTASSTSSTARAES